ncbi:MAG: nucleoside/nucleotide kinase family protein [Lachnospiraceae bacterium]|nr:nucleoside/nucleotide kinase family protein [Lachnospiraceae bacterium]
MTEYKVNINGIEVNARFDEDNIREIFLPLLRKLTDLQAKKGKRLLVFLAAPPGAGKSTLASFLEMLASENEDIAGVQAIGMDGFHRRQEYLLSHSIVREGKEIPMIDVKGAPETFDLEKLENAIMRVSSGEVCGWPVYDRLLHNPLEDAVTVNEKIVILEGNYLLLNIDGWERLSSYADYSIMIRAEEYQLRERLVSRRIASGHDKESSEKFVDFSDMYNAGLCLGHAGSPDLLLRLNNDGSYIAAYEEAVQTDACQTGQLHRR